MDRKIIHTALAAVTAPAVGAGVLCLSTVGISVVDMVVTLPTMTAIEALSQVSGSFATIVFLLGLAICYVIALPLALVLHVILRRVGWKKGWHYAAAGGILGLGISLPVLFLLAGPSFVLLGMMPYGVAGAVAGACAAAAFWGIAIRRRDDRASSSFV